MGRRAASATSRPSARYRSRRRSSVCSTTGPPIHRSDGLDPKPQAGGDPNSYQLPLPIVALIPGGARYDTLFMVKGIEMYSSTISAGGQTAAIPRQIGFGKVPQLAVGPEAIWFTPSDKFEIHRRSTGGALLRCDSPRPADA